MPYSTLLGLLFSVIITATASAAGLYDPDEELAGILGHDKPLLRLTYTAGSKGEMYPCVTCGTNSLGGLARRLTVLKQLDEGIPHIHIAGSEEFLSDLDLMRFNSPDWNPSDPVNLHNETEKARRLLKGHSLLGVDAGYLLPEEAQWLQTYAKGLPAGFTTVKDTPLTKIISIPTGKVGIVLFPKGKGTNLAPTDQQIKDVLQAGKNLQKQVNLVIGVSPWGNVHEYRFLKEGTGVYHILFGGGGGLGAPYEPEHSTEQLLWIRSESHGRAVNSLDILEMPQPNRPASWVEGLTFNAAQVFLLLKLPPDHSMEDVTGNAAKDWHREK